MVKLIEGNVLLKPSQRRQLMGWLKRVQRLGERMGNFVLTITMQRTGRHYQVNARVHDTAGDFDCRMRRHDWRTALRDLVHSLVTRLHDQCLQRKVIA